MDRVENEGLDEFAGEGDSLSPSVAPAAAAVPVQAPAAAPGRLKPVVKRGLIALVLLIAYAGVVIGIWDRAVMSDRRRALASVEAPLPQASQASAMRAPAPTAPVVIPKAVAAAPPPATLESNLAPRETTPAPSLTTPVSPKSTSALPKTAASKTAPPKTASAPPKTTVRAVGKRALARRVPAQNPSPAQPARFAQVPMPQPRNGVQPPPAGVAALAPTVSSPPAIQPPGNPLREVSSDLVRQPPSAAVTVAVDPLAADRSAVADVLAAYRKSYNNLDAEAALAVWDGVDERALRHAFSGLSRQHLSFDRCDVRVQAADRAAARCDGVLSYAAKVGDGSAQQRRLTWNMDLHRDGDRWKIVSVKTR